MRGYKIEENKHRWKFCLIPSNNNTQPIGFSTEYDSYEDCVYALSEFREWIRINRINSVNSPYISIVKNETKIYFLYIKEGMIIFESRHYEISSGKTYCDRSIKSIYQNLDEYTQNQIV